MKKNVTYVDACHFEKLIVASGLPATVQAGFVKVSGAKGRNVYVARTKRVGRVDISGFTLELPGVRDLDPESECHGSVSQGLDFSLPEADILTAFELLLAHMATLPEAEPRKRVMPKRDDDAIGWTTLTAQPAQISADAE